jgi:hypothetical protein
MAKVKKTMAQGFASGELWDVLSDLVDDLTAIKNLVNDLKAKYNVAVTLINELKTDLHEHTHQVTHAACSATSAIYGTDTALTSTTGPSITSASSTATSVDDVALKTSK